MSNEKDPNTSGIRNSPKAYGWGKAASKFITWRLKRWENRLATWLTFSVSVPLLTVRWGGPLKVSAKCAGKYVV